MIYVSNRDLVLRVDLLFANARGKKDRLQERGRGGGVLTVSIARNVGTRMGGGVRFVLCGLEIWMGAVWMVSAKALVGGDRDLVWDLRSKVRIRSSRVMYNSSCELCGACRQTPVTMGRGYGYGSSGTGGGKKSQSKVWLFQKRLGQDKSSLAMVGR